MSDYAKMERARKARRARRDTAPRSVERGGRYLDERELDEWFKRVNWIREKRRVRVPSLSLAGVPNARAAEDVGVQASLVRPTEGAPRSDLGDVPTRAGGDEDPQR